MPQTVKVGVALSLVAVSVLAYGYCRARRHGALYIQVVDVADREGAPPEVVPLELSFLDARGRLLAQAAKLPTSAAQISGPAIYSCTSVERQAPSNVVALVEWNRCVERQSKWIPTWIKKVTAVNLRSETCAMDGLPMSVSTHSDWWLWWVPLRHVGGNPHTLFSLRIEFDRKRCR